MPKPVVHYAEMYFCELGKSAMVILADNPTGKPEDARVARTSRVQAFDPASGEFETLNTLYKPAPGVAVHSPALQ